MSFLVDTFGTEKVDVSKITAGVNEIFDMRPRAIIERLNLMSPIYSPTAAYGHFGREHESSFTWERLEYIDALKDFCK